MCAPRQGKLVNGDRSTLIMLVIVSTGYVMGL